MPDGHPKFGDGAAVPYLDIGQDGGTRQAAATAKLSGYILRGVAVSVQATHSLVQQGITFQDNLGFSGSMHTLVATIRASTRALFNTIVREIDQRKTGQLRDVNGNLGAFDPQYIKATELTDFDGSVLAAKVKLARWNFASRIYTNSEWTFANVKLVFRVLA